MRKITMVQPKADKTIGPHLSHPEQSPHWVFRTRQRRFDAQAATLVRYLSKIVLF